MLIGMKIRCREQGFSLIEMAMVLVILGILLGGLLVAVGQSTENTRRINTRNELREIREALYGFAILQGRLPCPADFDSDGFETQINPTGNTCELYHGFLPSATLNLAGNINQDGLMTDAWGNPYRYSVAQNTPGGYRYTSSSELNDIFAEAADEVVVNNEMLRVCDNSNNGENCAGSSNVLAAIVPALVLSMGKNWAELSGASSANEQLNALDDNHFVVAGYSEQNFDDMLIWLSPQILFTRMVAAGKLP